MKILFLSHYFPPEVNAPASRTFEHCRQWVRDGHEVTVVTCAPNHPRGRVYEGYKNRLLQRETMEGIRVIRVWTFVTANERILKRSVNYVSFMVSAIAAVLWMPRADVVVTTSPQFFNGLAGYFVSRLKRMPWVLEIRDLWPESIVAVGAMRNRTVIGVLEYLERLAYRKADLIVPVTDAFKRYMIGKGIDEGKIAVIKNGVDLGFYQPGVEGDALREELGLTGRFVVSYVGTHGMAHHLDTVLEAAVLVKNPDIVFLLVGEGADRSRLIALRDRMGLENVLMLAQLPKAKMPALWAITDVSLVLLKRSDLFKTVIPSKIFESMAMKRPLVLGVEGEAKEIIERAEAGICIEPENAGQLAQAVMLLHDDRTLSARCGQNGRRHVEAYFDRTALARKYEQLLCMVASARDSRACVRK